MQCLMGVPAEYAVDITGLGVGDGSVHDARCHAPPIGGAAIDVTLQGSRRLPQLWDDIVVKEISHVHPERIALHESVELVTVNR